MTKKAELLEAIAGKNRGLLANEKDKVMVLSLVEQLEDYNPTPYPFEAKQLLDGDWRLLYTTSSSILGLDRIPLWQLGNVYQCLRLDEGKVYNIAEINGLPWTESIVSVVATFDIVSKRRVNVKFERSILGLQKVLNYQNPAQFIDDIEAGKKFLPLDFGFPNREQKAWLEITYLDGDLRISRGNEGNVFVLTKEK